MDFGKLLFGDNSNNTTYKQAAYDKYYNDISNAMYDTMYGDMGNYLDENYSGGSRKFKFDTLQSLNDTAKNSLANYKATKNNVFGNGLIGSMLNPIAQTVSAASDLGNLAFSGGKYNAWDASQNDIGDSRDIGSDIGALGETALTLGTLGHGALLGKASKAVQAGTATAKQANMVAKALGKTAAQNIVGGALVGAGYGAAGNLRQSGFENFNPQAFALSTLIGGGLGGATAGIGSAINKYRAGVQITTTTRDSVPYQEALDNLKNNATSAIYSDTPTNLPAVKGIDVSRVNLNNLDKNTLRELFKSSSMNVKGAEGANEMTRSIMESKDLLTDFLDNGIPATTTTTYSKNAGDILKAIKNKYNASRLGTSKLGKTIGKVMSTKTGKIAATAGGAAAIAKLIPNGENKVDYDNLTDEEWQQIINYYNNGGQ